MLPLYARKIFYAVYWMEDCLRANALWERKVRKGVAVYFNKIDVFPILYIIRAELADNQISEKDSNTYLENVGMQNSKILSGQRMSQSDFFVCFSLIEYYQWSWKFLRYLWMSVSFIVHTLCTWWAEYSQQKYVKIWCVVLWNSW